MVKKKFLVSKSCYIRDMHELCLRKNRVLVIDMTLEELSELSAVLEEYLSKYPEKRRIESENV